MKVISTGLRTHLSQDTTTLATCVKVTRRDGVVLGYTTHDQPLTFDCDGLGAVTYEPQGGYKRSAIESQLGLAADNVELEGLLLTDGGLTDEDLLKGIYDNAELKFMLVNWADVSQGVLKLRRGYVGAITVHRDSYLAEIRGLMDAYSTVIGELYTPDCRADLGDSRCQVDLDTPEFTVACTVAAVTAPQPGDNGTWQFQVTPDLSHLVPEEGGIPWFAMGKASWLTGANSGTYGEVKAWDGATSTASLFLATTFPIVVGDTLTLTVGCDKRRVTCIRKFDNIVNMRGEPYLPGLDAALQYPSPHTV